MIEMGKKGVNLGTINACLGKPVSLETRMTVQGPTIKADFNKHKGHLKTEKSIRDAVNHLLEKLKPVLYDYELSVEVNRKTENLIEALRDFHPNLGEYLDLLLAQTVSIRSPFFFSGVVNYERHPRIECNVSFVLLPSPF